jgi:hypothetical protein
MGNGKRKAKLEETKEELVSCLQMKWQSGSVEIGKLEECLSVGVWFEFVCFPKKAKGLLSISEEQ